MGRDSVSCNRQFFGCRRAVTVCKPGVMVKRVSKGQETGEGVQLHAHRWRKGVSKNRIGVKE